MQPKQRKKFFWLFTNGHIPDEILLTFIDDEDGKCFENAILIM